MGLNNRYFTDNRTEININYSKGVLVINCKKTETTKNKLQNIISECITCADGVNITEFIKFEWCKIRVLKALNECVTVIDGGLATSFSRTNMHKCDISFDLVFNTVNNIIKFDTVKNIKA